jgi:hypothetical protein
VVAACRAWPRLWLWALLYAVFCLSPVRIQSDSVWAIPTALSLLNEGDVDLDEYQATVDRVSHGTDVYRGHTVGTFPLAPALVALVPVLLFRLTAEGAHMLLSSCGLSVDFVDRQRALLYQVGDVRLESFALGEQLIASACVTSALVILYTALRRRFDATVSFRCILIVGLGTSAYSTASRVLWQHGPSLLAVSGCIFWASTETLSRRRAVAFGLTAGLAYFCRPTNALVLAAMLGWVVLTHPRRLFFFFLGALAPIVALVANGLLVFGQWIPPYFMAQRLEFGGALFQEALLGNLFSPARGLLVFSPVLAWTSVRFFWPRERSTLTLSRLSGAAVVAHWISISCFPHWWAGHCFGPRFFCDVLPLFVFPLADTLQSLATGVRWQRVAFWLTAAFSIAVHFRGATSLATHRWNDGPPNVDQAPERLWDWGDLQFMRGLASSQPAHPSARLTADCVRLPLSLSVRERLRASKRRPDRAAAHRRHRTGGHSPGFEFLPSQWWER